MRQNLSIRMKTAIFSVDGSGYKITKDNVLSES